MKSNKDPYRAAGQGLNAYIAERQDGKGRPISLGEQLKQQVPGNSNSLPGFGSSVTIDDSVESNAPSGQTRGGMNTYPAGATVAPGGVGAFLREGYGGSKPDYELDKARVETIVKTRLGEMFPDTFMSQYVGEKARGPKESKNPSGWLAKKLAGKVVRDKMMIDTVLMDIAETYVDSFCDKYGLQGYWQADDGSLLREKFIEFLYIAPPGVINAVEATIKCCYDSHNVGAETTVKRKEKRSKAFYALLNQNQQALQSFVDGLEGDSDLIQVAFSEALEDLPRGAVDKKRLEQMFGPQN